MRGDEDHLHTRGEYGDSKYIGGGVMGSPPHTWRILHLDKVSIFVRGITSTHVENTLQNSDQLHHEWDHLHTRGEYRLR